MNSKKIFGNLAYIILLVCLIGFISASSISVWQGQYYTGTTFNTGTYVFNFSVYDSLTGGSVCFTNTTSLTTGNWGEWKTEQSPWGNCTDASKDYFLNLNIAGGDVVPRRRLTVSDFLRRDVAGVQSGNLIVSDNVSASYYIGDGRYLVGVNGSGDINSVQGDGVYLYNGSNAGEVVLALNESRLNSTIDARASGLGDNSSWNESYADTKYILGNSEGALNVNSSIYSNSSSWWAFVSSWVSGWFYNEGGALAFNETKLNATIDARSSFSESDPLWSANFTLYNSTWSLDSDTNESVRLEALVGTDCSTGELVIGVQENGTVLCAVDSGTTYSHLSNFTDDLLWTSGFNSTGDFLWLDDTQKNAAGYLYNDSNTIYLNETKLNATIDSRGNGDNSSWNESYANAKYLNLSGTNANQNVDIGIYNLTIGDKLTFGLNEIIDNLVDGWLRIVGGLNITGNAIIEGGLNTTNDSYFLSDVYISGKLKGLSPLEVEGGLNVSGETTFTDNVNFSGIVYGNGSQLTDIEADSLAASSVTTSSIADNNITDVKILNLSWDKLVFVPSGLDDGDNYTIYYNSTGLGLNASNYFSISTGYQMPQGCNDGEIAEYNTSSLGWDCAVDNSAASGMASWVLVASDSVGSESVTDGESVTFSDDSKYLNATRVTNTITYSVDEARLNATIDARDSDTTYSHLSNFTDDLGSRGYTSLSNFTDDLGILTQVYGNNTYHRLSDFDIANYFTSAQVLGFDYYNSTDFSISDYYLNSNPYGYYNLTSLPASSEVDPYWSGNMTNVAFTNTEEVFEGNVTVEGILFEQDTVNHRIYDNSSCVIIKGDTSTMYIC